MKKLTRSDNKIIGGVLGGVGEYLDIDPTVIRLIYVFVTVCTALLPAIIVYLVALALIPLKHPHKSHDTHQDPQV